MPNPAHSAGPSRMSSRRSPGFRMHGRSPVRRMRIDEHRSSLRGLSPPPRSRDRREFRPSPSRMRSRSPVKIKSFSPKRKASPPRERMRETDGQCERDKSRRAALLSRKHSRSKSPTRRLSSREPGPCIPSYKSPSPEMPPKKRIDRTLEYPPTSGALEVVHRGGGGSLGERFRSSSTTGYEKPVFQGPDGIKYDTNQLKELMVIIKRKLPANSDPSKGKIIDPEDVVIVRRPAQGDYSHWRKGEGSRPLFAREEIMEASLRLKHEHPSTSVEHKQTGTLLDSPVPSTSRYESPERYPASSSRSHDYGPPRGERAHSGQPREYVRSSRDRERSHGPSYSMEKHDDRFDRHREDLRFALELRRRDDGRYPSHGKSSRRSYDNERDYPGEPDRRGSDLRMRINEKRTDRSVDRDLIHHRLSDDHHDRDRRQMIQPSPPGSERRRGPPEDNYRLESERPKMRGESRSSSAVGHRDDIHEGFRHSSRQPSDFSPRNERFPKPWEGNPEYVPKGRAYYEHDNRDNEMRFPVRGRGMMNPRGNMRGRIMSRGRPFSGGPYRSGYMGNRGAPRSRGYTQRGYFHHNMY